MKINSRLVKCASAFFLCSSFLFARQTAYSQSICGPIVEDFDKAGGSTAGFIGDFQSASSGSNGLLLKSKVVASGVYSITTPTYQLPNDALYLGFGFSLNGSEHVARAEVVVTYVSTLTNEPTKVFLGQFVPTYFPGESTADICRAAQLSDLPGFPAGGQYRFRIELTPNTGGGSPAETIGFNDFRTNGGVATIPLPVSFLAFEAKKTTGGVQLTWKVAGEESVAYYEVERSDDGHVFSSIGRISRKGNDTYSYTDAANSTLAYYRIRNVEKDGRVKYSAIARLSANNSSTLKAFPQPARNTLTLQHPTAEGKASLHISTADGRLLRLAAPVAGSSQTTIDLASLQSGVYMICFENGDGSLQSIKLVKL